MSPVSHRRTKPELLAPAGNRTALSAALKAGCDAVYLGARQFNMRGAPANFTPREIQTAHQLCQDAGARLYITLNTIVYQRELATLYRLVDKLAGKVDAVICWDPAVIMACKQAGIPFHVSTQASIANPAAAEFYRQLGAQRIVLARECTLQEIRKIRKAVPVQLEVFAHGAMCVSVSGRCFLSQDTTGHSGNRGDCRQTCRRPFRVICQDGPGDFEVTPGDSHIFSAKDLCTIPFIDQLLDAGVASLKIEGRNRPADYVSTVIRAYRTAIDAWASHELTQELKDQLVKSCRTVFNRDFSNGFYLGRPIQDFTTHENSAATRRRELIGKVLNYYRKPKVAHVVMDAKTLQDGDTVVIMGPTTGVVEETVRGLRVERNPQNPNLHPTATFTLTQQVRPNDQLYLVASRSQTEKQHPENKQLS